jgi:hypothetical protein
MADQYLIKVQQISLVTDVSVLLVAAVNYLEKQA